MHDSGRVNFITHAQNILRAVFDKFIGEAEHLKADAGNIIGGQPFVYSGAETASKGIFLHRHPFDNFLGYFQQHFRIKRLDKSYIYDTCVNAGFGKIFCGFDCAPDAVAGGNYRHFRIFIVEYHLRRA